MVIKKIVTSLCSFMSLRGWQRIKHRSSHAVITFDIAGVVKEGSNDSLGGGSRYVQATLEGETCCVCLSRLEEGEDMRVLPCQHKFHRACVNRWLNGCQKTCPVCRFSVENEEKYRVKEALTEEMVTWFSSFHVAGF